MQATETIAAARLISVSLLLVLGIPTALRRLWATDTLFTTIPCLEMIEVPITDCCDYAEQHTIARSKYKLPRIAEGIYNYVIQGVYSINVLGGSGKKLKEITINRYLNLLKLPSRKNEEYFWIHDGYLYVTSAMVEKVRITALFEDGVPNFIMYPEDCECTASTVSDEDYCMNPLDKEFYLPGYLENQVMGLVSKSLKESYFQIQQDVSSEGIDGQQVNSGPTN